MQPLPTKILIKIANPNSYNISKPIVINMAFNLSLYICSKVGTLPENMLLVGTFPERPKGLSDPLLQLLLYKPEQKTSEKREKRESKIDILGQRKDQKSRLSREKIEVKKERKQLVFCFKKKDLYLIFLDQKKLVTHIYFSETKFCIRESTI